MFIIENINSKLCVVIRIKQVRITINDVFISKPSLWRDKLIILDLFLIDCLKKITKFISKIKIIIGIKMLVIKKYNELK